MNHNSILQKTEEKKNLTQGENTKKKSKKFSFQNEREKKVWMAFLERWCPKTEKTENNL